MKNRFKTLSIIMLIWFVLSFLSNIIGPILPDVAKGFQLDSNTLLGLIPTSVFLAYGFMSIPAGLLVGKWGEKKMLLLGFGLPLIGILTFTLTPSYPTLLFSCFILGIGMTILQTVINPLQRVVGGEENYAVVACLGIVIFGLASATSPHVYTYLTQNLKAESYVPNQNIVFDTLHALIPPNLPWVAMYILFIVIILVMLGIIALNKFPKIEQKAEEKDDSKSSYKELFGNKYVWLFFLGIFCYTSTEQGISNFISLFLEKYHGLDPQTIGATVVSRFWGSLTIGCVVSLVLLRLYDSKKILSTCGFLATALLIIGLYAPTNIAIYALPAIAFFMSAMFGIIFSLALNSVTSNHASFAGILCSGVVGGAFGPLVVGSISDWIDLRTGMLFIAVFTLYIASIGFWAKPLINNKTVTLRQLFSRK
ncbi:MAG: MFS transporter [Bacteroidaceae bacterium]